MPTTLTLKNIPDEVYQRLKASAESHRRSLNSEAIVCLESVLIPGRVAVSELGITGVDGYAVRVENGKHAEVETALAAICKRYGVLLNSKADITRTITRMSNGISGLNWGLVGLGFVVAAFGVVNTLSMNVLEQTRELGLLRIVAMTKEQVRRTIVAQALIIGAVGLLPGVLRAELLAEGRCREAELAPDDLRGAFLVGNALRGLIRAELVAAG